MARTAAELGETYAMSRPAFELRPVVVDGKDMFGTAPCRRRPTRRRPTRRRR